LLEPLFFKISLSLLVVAAHARYLILLRRKDNRLRHFRLRDVVVALTH